MYCKYLNEAERPYLIKDVKFTQEKLDFMLTIDNDQWDWSFGIIFFKQEKHRTLFLLKWPE
jgi:hypothetical protein